MGEPAIGRQEGDTKGTYRLVVDGAVAELTYSRAGAAMIIIDHTGVPDALRGRGLGEQLVERAVADARQEGRKVLPLCPFAKALIARRSDLQDVL